jgi:hypothetical protein
MQPIALWLIASYNKLPKHIYSMKTYVSQEQLNEELLFSCRAGDEILIQNLLTRTCPADIHYNEDSPVIAVCQQGSLPVLKYLLTSSDLKEHAYVHAREDEGFRQACINGHIPIIDYLLNLPCMTQSDKVYQSMIDWGFLNACMYDQVQVAEFFLSDSHLAYHPNIHLQNDLAFIKALNAVNSKIISYFIFEKEIEQTVHIMNYIEKSFLAYHNQQEWMKNEVLKMFKVRDLHHNLEDKLVIKPCHECRKKI